VTICPPRLDRAEIHLGNLFALKHHTVSTTGTVRCIATFSFQSMILLTS